MDSNHSGKSARKLPVLIFVHNYLYLDNLAKIDYLYRKRFSRIFHLIPLYDKERDDPHNQHHNYNIIPVQHTGFSFQNGFFQGFGSYESTNVSHYIFINDDLTLNPAINESNYQEFFKLNSEQSYLPGINNHNNAYSILPWKHNFAYAKMENNLIQRNFMLAAEIPPPSVGKYMRAWLTPPPAWSHAMSAYNFRPHKRAFDNKLPPSDEVLEKFKQFGLLTDHIMKQTPPAVWEMPLLRKIFHKAKNAMPKLRDSRFYLPLALITLLLYRKDIYRPHKLHYPLVHSYSDLLIVSNNHIRKFIEFCGLFGIFDLAHETAIPTALLMATNNREQMVLNQDLEHKFVNYLGHKEDKILQPLKQLRSVAEIIEKFPKNYSYVHPIKLSRLKLS